MWFWLGCVPAEVEEEAVALAAYVLVADVNRRLAEENERGLQVDGDAELRIEPDPARSDPDWSGQLDVEVAWGGDPDGACACRGDCGASAWTWSAAVDLRLRRDSAQSWCALLAGEPPEADPPDLDLSGSLAGAGGLGPDADDEDCAASWPAWTGQGTLTVASSGRSHELRVEIAPDTDAVWVRTGAGEWSWQLNCGG